MLLVLKCQTFKSCEWRKVFEKSGDRYCGLRSGKDRKCWSALISGQLFCHQCAENEPAAFYYISNYWNKNFYAIFFKNASKYCAALPFMCCICFKIFNVFILLLLKIFRYCKQLMGDKNIAICPDTTRWLLPWLNSCVPYLFCSTTLY